MIYSHKACKISVRYEGLKTFIRKKNHVKCNAMEVTENFLETNHT